MFGNDQINKLVNNNLMRNNSRFTEHTTKKPSFTNSEINEDKILADQTITITPLIVLNYFTK